MENVLGSALSHLPLWGRGSKAQLFKRIVFICLKITKRKYYGNNVIYQNLEQYHN